MHYVMCVLSLVPWSGSANELYRLSDRRLSAKLVSTFTVNACHVVSATDPHGYILGFFDRLCVYFCFQIKFKQKMQ
jgi:hypothetical protein